ncbi:TonB-dependent receptor [Pedobacter sp. AJM]|uniref:SusC/RagA family TonB-linked outer membrane protein n=1 Tax=Pedobacter sp. AJM TaxID=2003629 RepID=UPI000B4BB560|nr:TonB-dependent receptor [Pedobacter sp. AJM]OWK68806.1 SusC/RagA family protein [Pedobacter sp. AJM]
MNLFYRIRLLLRRDSYQILLTMRLTVLLFILTLMQVSASSFSQNLTLKHTNADIFSVLKQIEKQSGYHLLFRRADIDEKSKINVNVINMPVEQAMVMVLKNTNLDFKIIKKTIILKKRTYLPSTQIQIQEIEVSGTVSDEKGVTLPGVAVKVKDSKVTAVTDINGRYKISVPSATSILVFSFVGMETQEIVPGKRNTLNVVLKNQNTVLSDVVVIGYGTQKRSDINGSISSVKASDIENVPQVSIDQMLQGRASGLTISQNSGAPGSNTSVRVRGITSLSGSNEPLYVIDGVPISGDASNQSTSGRSPLQASSSNANSQTTVSPLSLINPNDIESIDVLKDASATAIYGNRASNGVIIITTKRGKTGNSAINYDGYYGFQRVAKYMDVMDLKQYARLQNSLGDIYGTGRRVEFADPSILGEGTNWQKEIFRTAAQQSHQIAVSGGKEGLNYYISGGYLGQDGTVIGSDFRRYSLRTNVDAQVKEWFKLGITLTASRSAENVITSDNNGIIYNALLQGPDLAVTNLDGSYTGPPLSDPLAAAAALNPVAQAQQIKNKLNRSNINTNIYNEIKVLKPLSLRSELGGDFNFSDNNVFTPSYSWGRFTNPTASLQERHQQSTFLIWKEYLNYNQTFGKHNLSAILGYEVQESTWRGIEGRRQGFFSNDVQSLNLGQAITATNDEYIGTQRQESVYARAIYTYGSKYSLTSTIRKDKTSKFAEGSQSGYFPSFAASWKLSDESFMKGINKVVSGVKIRLGYGEVGNQDVPNYLYSSLLRSSQTGLGTGFLAGRIDNKALKWQTSIQYNAGLDMSFLNGKINTSIDIYKKTSKDFLFQLTLPAYLVGGPDYLGGINPPYVNLGKIDNVGFDLTINTRNIDNDHFKWNTNVVLSHYKNEVKELGNGLTELFGTVTNAYLQTPVTRTVVGRSVGEFYGYRVKGIFKTEDQLRAAPVQFGRTIANNSNSTWLGDVQYEDVNGDGVVNEKDRTAIGNPNPKFTYGITNTFSYKAFDFTVFLNGSYGAKIMNLLNNTMGNLANVYQNQYAAYSNFWTPQNPDSNIPAPKIGIDNPNLVVSDRYVESGSFLRIQNMSLGYKVPAAWIRKFKFSNLKVYSSVQNLYTFTKYKGYDPEIGAINQSAILNNIDLGRYPIARTITFGINAQF